MLSIMSAGAAAFWLCILGTPVLMRWLRRKRIGQQIREDGPSTHTAKAGTPTMGGLAIVGAVVGGYLVGHIGDAVRFSAEGVLVVITVVLFGAIGALDDWIKVRNHRSLGLNKRAKFGAQVAVAVLFAELAVHWAHTATTLSFTRMGSPGTELGEAGWVAFAVFVLVGASNAVNLTDGLDGLAAGSSTMSFSVLAILGYWIFRHEAIFHVLPAYAIDLALTSVALGGACLGFLWWNAAPAKIIMGDTGSLAIGSGLGALCLLLNLDLLLPILGGLFVIETLSVIGQVLSFRVFHRRILRMAPIHHHFELSGWPETTVIVRLWICAGLFAALALGIFYGVYLTVARF
ncbi:MAG: phospho-N-acetylmuramoyl-pentapeptide-transferase [Actinomycetota bacterium]|nr:phospho-N-acetylmuramoyl-pentapeptide-transferase [Actinomycetota bacterium]